MIKITCTKTNFNKLLYILIYNKRKEDNRITPYNYETRCVNKHITNKN